MLEITGINFLMTLVATGLVLAVVILLIRWQLARRGRQQLLTGHNKPLPSFVKQYPAVNVFKQAPTILRFSLAVSLMLVFFAFNWTTYEREVYIPDHVTFLDGGPEVIRTPPPPLPPPPPPPPPPVIEEVPEAEVEEDVEFEDTTVEEETEVIAPPQPPAPPPPPTIEDIPTPSPPPPIEIVEEDPEANKIFINVQQMPRFIGCEDIGGTNTDKKVCAEKKMLEFIYKNINYPTIARENGIQGMAVISFVIEKDGSVTTPQIIRNVAGGCGKEALRVVKTMPKWIPGKQRNKAVRVQFNLPVRFKLQN